MEIWICNKEQVPSIIDEIDKRPFAHISITSYKIGEWPQYTRGCNCVASLHIRFDDVDEADNNSVPIKDIQGKLIATFIDSIYRDIDILLINCEAGISRSAGLASAIAYMYHDTDTKYESKTGILPHPNRKVFWTIVRSSMNLQYD